MNTTSNRRKFLSNSTQMAVGAGVFHLAGHKEEKSPNIQTSVTDINIVGPKEGFTPQIGTLVSMMNWMRNQILYPVRGMSAAELDYIHDDNSNSIGAMLLHLAATERFYQLNTFEERTWGEWPEKDSKEWDIPMGLGPEARSQIKGNSLDFYLDKLEKIREDTLQEFSRRDDEWLLKVDKSWFWGPTNNYCKWFHVCEHESNHNGQIKYIKSRVAV